MAFSIAFSTLMVLLSGSDQDLIDLWNISGGVNDPSGNKHELDLPDVICGGNFRSAIVDNWQMEAFDSVSVYGMNIFGDIFWETEFNVTGSASFHMDDWLRDSYIVRSSDVSQSTQSVIYNDQKNYRLRITPTTYKDKSWFAVSNISVWYGPLPLIFVPRSVSEPFTNPVFSQGSLGCWSFDELVNSELNSIDDTAMSPASCIERCWDKATVAMLEIGKNCYCADRNTSINQTDHVFSCGALCTGEPCGGFVTNIGNAYHVQGSKLPGYVETERLFRRTFYQNKTILIDVSDIFGNSSTLVYLTRIILNVTKKEVPVFTMNGLSQTTQKSQVTPEYTVWYNEHNCSESITNMKVVSFVKPEPTVFQANGSVAEVDILRARCIQLRLNETAPEVSIEIWGPNETTMNTSTRSISTTTTLSTTTSPTTPTTASTTTSTVQTLTTSTSSSVTSSTVPTSSATTALSTTTTTTSLTATTTKSTISSSQSIATTQSPSTTTSTSTFALFTTSTKSPATKSTCSCPCNTTAKQLNLTTAQLQEKIDEIQRRLAVNVSKLSKTIRKLTSAKDKRVSATSIGYLGVGIIVSILAAIVFIDSPVLFRDMKMFYKNIRGGFCPHKRKRIS